MHRRVPTEWKLAIPTNVSTVAETGNSMSELIPRLGFEELPEELQVLLEARVKRLGYLGEFFQCFAHQPEALIHFQKFNESAKEGLPQSVVPVIVLTVGIQMDARYELNQFERLSIRQGKSLEWVQEVERCDTDNTTLLSEREKIVQRYILKAVQSRGHDCKAELDSLISELGHERAVSVLFVLARYYGHSIMVNSIGLRPPVDSIFDDGFSG